MGFDTRVLNNPVSLGRIRADNNDTVATLSTGAAVIANPLVNSSAVYFIGDGDFLNGYKIYRVPLPGGVGANPPPLLAGATPALNQFDGLAVDDTAVYWINLAGQLVSCPPAGCSGPPTVLVLNASTASSLTMDSQALYWLVPTYDANFNVIASSIFRVAR